MQRVQGHVDRHVVVTGEGVDDERVEVGVGVPDRTWAARPLTSAVCPAGDRGDRVVPGRPDRPRRCRPRCRRSSRRAPRQGRRRLARGRSRPESLTVTVSVPPRALTSIASTSSRSMTMVPRTRVNSTRPPSAVAAMISLPPAPLNTSVSAPDCRPRRRRSHLPDPRRTCRRPDRGTRYRRRRCRRRGRRHGRRRRRSSPLPPFSVSSPFPPSIRVGSAVVKAPLAWSIRTVSSPLPAAMSMAANVARPNAEVGRAVVADVDLEHDSDRVR